MHWKDDSMGYIFMFYTRAGSAIKTAKSGLQCDVSAKAHVLTCGLSCAHMCGRLVLPI